MWWKKKEKSRKGSLPCNTGNRCNQKRATAQGALGYTLSPWHTRVARTVA